MISAIIVENEAMHSDYLKALLEKEFPEIQILDICDSMPVGIESVKKHNPNLLFLDVELPPFTGFDLLEGTKDIQFEVIFTTSWNKYAAKAFRFCALDFIEKPFGVEQLKESVMRYKNLVSSGSRKNIEALLHNVKQTDSSMQKFGIPVLGGIDFITIADIIFCQSDDNCTNFFLTQKRKITATKTLKWVEDMLKEQSFFRVHDSYMINLNHIVSYKRGGEGGVVELTDSYEADVSRRRKDEFMKLLVSKKMISGKYLN